MQQPAHLSIAVVIPTKNRPEQILCTLESIARQRTQPNRIIVVDQTAVPYSLPPLPNLVHIHDPSIDGAAAARNAGARVASTDIVLFIDDDIELMTDCVGEIRAVFEAHPDAVGAQCKFLFQKTLRPISFENLVKQIFERGFFNSNPIKRAGFTELRSLGAGAAAFRSALLAHELFDETLTGYSLGEDWEFARRARRYGKLVLAERAEAFHHESPIGRIALERFFRLKWRNHLYFYDKHDAGADPRNRFYRIWWMIGESLRWMRYGMDPRGLAQMLRDELTGARRSQR